MVDSRVAPLPRTYARIDRRILAENFESIRRAVGPGVTTVAVIKADAYGHGAIEVARTLAAAGARHFAVACCEEGIELREAGIEGKILLLGGLETGREHLARNYRLTPVIHSARQLRNWEKQAITGEEELPFHLEMETGMNRLGLEVKSADELASLLSEAPHLRLEGLATHLASAEDFTSDQSARQHRQLTELARILAGHGIRPRYVHVSNTAAVAYRPEMDSNLVRPGLALYGYLNPPAGRSPAPRVRVKPALEWKAKVLDVRDVAAGARLGYGASYQAPQAMRIGILSVGYGDGFSRSMSNGGEVLAGGVRCPVVGLVSMDVTAIDLSLAPRAAPDQEATLIDQSLDAAEMARRRGTIAYEVLCGISKRVARIYC